MKQIYREVDGVVKTVEDAMKSTERTIEPIRLSAFRRFPTLFTLLVGFGAGATFFGVERIIATTPFLNEQPWLILFIGILLLTITGRLHKKLD